MYDVIKICLKRRNKRKVGKKTPKKEMDNRRIFMTSYMTVFRATYQSKIEISFESYADKTLFSQKLKTTEHNSTTLLVIVKSTRSLICIKEWFNSKQSSLYIKPFKLFLLQYLPELTFLSFFKKFEISFRLRIIVIFRIVL